MNIFKRSICLEVASNGFLNMLRKLVCNVCLIHCNCFCIYNVKCLCIVKALFRVGMQVAPFSFKDTVYVVSYKQCCVPLSTSDYYFSLICMSCCNYDKVYVTNSKFFLTGPYNFLLHMYTLLLL